MGGAGVLGFKEGREEVRVWLPGSDVPIMDWSYYKHILTLVLQ